MDSFRSSYQDDPDASMLATKLGLNNEDDKENDSQATVRVRDWLNKLGRTLRLIFENVDKIDILQQIWPISNHGSILITTSSPVVSSKRAPNIMHLESFTPETGLKALYTLTGILKELLQHKKILNSSGGLPLAPIQISGLYVIETTRMKSFLWSIISQRQTARV